MKHRRRTRLWTLFAALALGLVVLPTVMVSATTGTMQITSDTTLTEDHNGPIEIIADNVILDCDGHKVIGSGTQRGINILNRTGVTVRDCHVSGFERGVDANNLQNSLLTGNTVTGNTDYGIGVYLSDGNTISDNTLTNNGRDGLGIYSSSLATVTGNTIAGHSDFGVKIVLTTSSLFDSNHVSGSGDNGFHLAGAVGNTLSGNTANDNGWAGFGLWDHANSNLVKGNHADGNGLGFEVGGSGDNVLEGNRAVGNLNDGFRLVEGSLSNSLKRNVAEDNAEHGFFIADTDVVNTVFKENQSHRNRHSGFADVTTGGMGTRGTDNSYSENYCTGNDAGGSSPSGLCQEERVGLVNPSSGEWHLYHSPGQVTTFYYGNPGDVPFMGDWDCDTVATPGLFRTSDAFAYLRNSNSQGIADIRFFFGNPSDIPLAGDFNGDGCDTLSIYRPSEARFYIINKLGENEGGLGAAEYSFLFGNPGDKPVVGDWDGDGVDEIGLHRETTGFFYYRNTLTTGIADGQFFFGDPGDRFVSGDWGVVDGVDTPAMFRPSNDTFYFRWTLTQGNADSEFVWTGAGMNWLPVSGDFTLD